MIIFFKFSNKVGQKGVLVAGGKKLAKGMWNSQCGSILKFNFNNQSLKKSLGSVLGKSFGAKANKFKGKKIEKVAGFKKGR